jgi:molecular chaperone IbpA
MNNLVSFTPLMRQTIGFDRFNDLFETLLNDKEERFEAYPPYNIEKIGDDEYRIAVAVAGFSESDLDVMVEHDRLIISGRLQSESESDGAANFLHRGIATRAFQRIFRLADHIQIEDASLKDGLLTVSLKREIPEEKKPRMIPINTKAKTLLGGKKK